MALPEELKNGIEGQEHPAFRKDNVARTTFWVCGSSHLENRGLRLLIARQEPARAEAIVASTSGFVVFGKVEALGVHATHLNAYFMRQPGLATPLG